MTSLPNMKSCQRMHLLNLLRRLIKWKSMRMRKSIRMEILKSPWELTRQLRKWWKRSSKKRIAGMNLPDQRKRNHHNLWKKWRRKLSLPKVLPSQKHQNILSQRKRNYQRSKQRKKSLIHQYKWLHIPQYSKKQQKWTKIRNQEYSNLSIIMWVFQSLSRLPQTNQPLHPSQLQLPNHLQQRSQLKPQSQHKHPNQLW